MGERFDAGQCFISGEEWGEQCITIPPTFSLTHFNVRQYELLAYSDIRNQVHWILSPQRHR
jgi:hypothetical protein